MMYIKYKTKPTVVEGMDYLLNEESYQRTTIWHVGQPSPEIDKDKVTSIQADSDELWHIISRFTNLPYVMNQDDAPVQRWYGDHAKFIVGNLK